MQRKSGTRAKVFFPMVVGQSGAFRSVLHRDCGRFAFGLLQIPHFARLLSVSAFPINVAETAKASLDMTAAAVEAAPLLSLSGFSIDSGG